MMTTETPEPKQTSALGQFQLSELLDDDQLSAWQYLSGLGMERAKWRIAYSHAHYADEETDLCLLLIRDTNFGSTDFGLRLGRASGDQFMDPDDGGWAGPVRYVVAYAPISI